MALRARKVRSDVTRIGEPHGELARMRDAAALFKVGIEARPAPGGDEQRQGKGGILEEAKKINELANGEF